MVPIAMNNLRRIDLNLLVTLEALLTEKSVTRAAKRLHLSQPSVSIQLRKIREIFSDPLLAVVPGGMAPTTRGQALLQPLRAALAEMQRVLAPRPRFDPETASMVWHVAAADYGEYAVLLPALAGLRETAPGIRVAVRGSSHARMIKQLESGTIDLGLLALDGALDRLHSRVLFEEHYVLVARKRHPAFRRRLTIARFSKL